MVDPNLKEYSKTDTKEKGGDRCANFGDYVHGIGSTDSMRLQIKAKHSDHG